MAANDPILGSGSTLTDKIMSGLVSQGFTTGTISDREYSRLKAKTGLSVGYTIADLYDRAGEAGRIYGDKTVPSGGAVVPPPATLVIVDDGLGNLSTTSTDVTDDLAGNLATVSTDVTDDGNGTLSSA
jgi:hypothetical protein